MPGWERRPGEAQRAAVKELSFVGPAEGVADYAQIVERVRDLGVDVSEAGLLQPESPAQRLLRPCVIALGRRALRVSDGLGDLIRLIHAHR